MTTPITRSGIIPAVIQHARVLDVNMRNYSLSVATEYAKKPLTDVQFMVPYTHSYNGEGIYFMPEVGSTCWVCKPSDGSHWFVLGWAAPQRETDYSARKQALNPGDIYLGTRDGNAIWLRRGGVIQIGGGGLCQRIYMPVNNSISDYCENFGLHALGGDLTWIVDRPDSTTDGSRPTTLMLSARQKANTAQPIASLQIGSHSGDDTTILTLKIRASEDSGADETITLQMGKDGSVTWNCESNFKWTVGGDWALSVTGKATLSSNKDVEISAGSAFSAKGTTTATMEAGGGAATVKSPAMAILDAPLVRAGGSAAAFPVAVAPPLMAWLLVHAHPIILPIPGTLTGPPVVPLPPTVASTTLFVLK